MYPDCTRRLTAAPYVASSCGSMAERGAAVVLGLEHAVALARREGRLEEPLHARTGAAEAEGTAGKRVDELARPGDQSVREDRPRRLAQEGACGPDRTRRSVRPKRSSAACTAAS